MVNCYICNKPKDCKKIISFIHNELMLCCKQCATENIQDLQVTQHSINIWNTMDADWKRLVCTSCQTTYQVRVLAIPLKDREQDKPSGFAKLPYCRNCATVSKLLKIYNEALL